MGSAGLEWAQQARDEYGMKQLAADGIGISFSGNTDFAWRSFYIYWICQTDNDLNIWRERITHRRARCSCYGEDGGRILASKCVCLPITFLCQSMAVGGWMRPWVEQGIGAHPLPPLMPLLSLLALDIAHFFTYSFLSLFFLFKLSVMLFPETEKLMGT